MGFEPEVVRDDAQLNQNIVVGKINSLTPHPHKKLLTICHVDTGSAVYQVICGGTNLLAGAKVVFALPGALLFNGSRIKATKFSGVKSHGMICSRNEVLPNQLSTSKIIVLPNEAVVGDSNPVKYLGFNDLVWKLHLTLGTLHCQNWFGLCHYLAQWWQLSLKDLPLPQTYQGKLTIKNVLSQSLPTDELVFMVSAQRPMQLPKLVHERLQTLEQDSGNFWTNLANYCRYFGGAKIEFATAQATQNYSELIWTKQLPKSLQAWLLIRVPFPPISDPYYLPPVYQLTTFVKLQTLFSPESCSSRTQYFLPPPVTWTLDPTTIKHFLGITLTIEDLHRLFRAPVWTIQFTSSQFHLTPPPTLPIQHEHQIIEEIIRFWNYCNLPAQPFTAADLPWPPSKNSEVTIWLQLQKYLVSCNLKSARLPFTITAPNPPFYQLPSDLIANATKMAINYDCGIFTIDTIWPRQPDQSHQEQQQLLIMLPAMAVPAKNQIWSIFCQQERLKIMLARILQLCQIPLQGLNYQPTVVKFARDSSDFQNNLTIAFHHNHKNSPLATIGNSAFKAVSKFNVPCTYLAINYDLLCRLSKWSVKSTTPNFQSVLSQAAFQQTYASFDITLGFAMPLQTFYQLKQSANTKWQVDYLAYLKRFVQQADKRIQHVVIRDLYNNQRLTLRLYWKVTDPNLKSQIRQKIQQKLEFQLKLLKNVKIY